MVNRKVIDISHWNTVTSWSTIKAAGIVGVIAKATQGSGSKDSTYLRNCVPAYRTGLQWGAYHFGDNSDVQAQVNNYLGVVGVDTETLYCLDWEDLPGKTMTAAQAQEWIESVESYIGVNRVVLYSGNTAKEALGSTKSAFFGAHRLWLAEYSSNPVVQASWDKYFLWQYSDSVSGPSPHGCPGVSGAVDTSSWVGSDADLIAQWTGASGPPPPPPPPPPPTVTITTTGGIQVIVNGVPVPLPHRIG